MPTSWTRTSQWRRANSRKISTSHHRRRRGRVRRDHHDQVDEISTDPGTPGVLNFTGTITDNDGGTNTCVLGGDVWCATLTVQNLGGARGHGCANSQSGKACSNPSHLTEDEFLHDGTDYDVTSISVTPNDELKLWLAPDPTAPTRTLVLVVDASALRWRIRGGRPLAAGPAGAGQFRAELVDRRHRRAEAGRGVPAGCAERAGGEWHRRQR